jgi:alpha-beta hydrolase superfamily lysophospholipase
LNPDPKGPVDAPGAAERADLVEPPDPAEPAQAAGPSGAAGPAGATRDSWEILGDQGRRLHIERWAPSAGGPEPPKPAVVIVHGFGEHADRYDYVARALAGAGRSTLAFDLAGHGRSDGPRAVVESVDEVVADIDRLVDEATSTSHSVLPVQADKPVLLGHSMGGAFAAAYATGNQDRLSALVLSAPALHFASSPRWQALAVQALAAMAPRAGVTRIDPAGLSHDADVVASFSSDPLVWHGRFPARTAAELYRASRLALTGAGALRLPTLILHGDADPIVPVRSSPQFFAALGSEDKELQVFPGLYHEPFHELNKDQVIAVLLGWLSRH